MAYLTPFPMTLDGRRISPEHLAWLNALPFCHDDGLRFFVHAGIDLLGLDVRRPNLEQIFVELTGEGFDVAR